MSTLARRLGKLEEGSALDKDWAMRMCPCICGIEHLDGTCTASLGEHKFSSKAAEAKEAFRKRVEDELTQAGEGNLFRWIVRVIVAPDTNRFEN